MSDTLTDAPILLTGFPGFLSNHLVRQLADQSDADIHFLCLEGTVETARRRLEQIEADVPALEDRWELHSGDIARPSLGLDPSTYERLTETIGVVWHLAAIYDLSVDERVAYRINVGGTVEILDFCEQCTDLERLNYISTCYVAGERTGRIFEGELDVGQRHKNHYESTKFWAEVEVQRRRDHIPTCIFRPAIVVGDSQTGTTTKYDGPYYVFKLLNRLPDWMPVPAIGSGDARVNLVPIDFVAESLAALGHRPQPDDAVYHLADPNPMTSRQIVDRTLETMGRRPTVGRLPARWVERALANDTVEAWTQIPQEALTYFNHRADFDTTSAQSALADANIECPRLADYLPRLLEFFLQHPEQPPTRALHSP